MRFVLRAPPSLGTPRALRSRWLSKGNPDPDGFHLKIVAAVARLYMDADERRSPLTAAFEDKGLGEPDFALFCALRHAPLTQPLPPRPPSWPVCVRVGAHFIRPPHAGDFASLFQQPRDEEQDKLFNEGLRASNVWYGHESTVCWMQTELPPGIRFDAHIAQTYDESGWCFVEAAISAGLKVGKRRFDLAKRTDQAMGCAYGDNCYGNDKLDPKGAYERLVPECILENVCAAARMPPLLPDEVRRRLDKKKFTSKADVDVVDRLYRAFFNGAASSAAQLDFRGLGWGEAEVQQLKEVLPRFTQLKALKCAVQPRTLPQLLPVVSA